MDGCETNFMSDYANTEIGKVISYFDEQLAGKRYLIADKLTGADIMMSFIVEQLAVRGILANYSNIARYADQLQSHEHLVKAQQIEAKYDNSVA